MNRSQCNYNRRIKRTDYEIGDLVLVCHPMLKKGLSKGLVRRYYGPFKVVGKYENGCDYLIKSTNQPKANVKQIHVNNLKTYFDRGQPKPSNKPSPFQDSKKSTDDEAKIQPNSQKKVQKRTVQPSRQEVVVPNEPQSESDEKSEPQSESEVEKPAAKKQNIPKA